MSRKEIEEGGLAGDTTRSLFFVSLALYRLDKMTNVQELTIQKQVVTLTSGRDTHWCVSVSCTNQGNFCVFDFLTIIVVIVRCVCPCVSSSRPRYKLHYFKARGRAEVTRLVFKAAGVPFVDETFTMGEWPNLKPSMPTGSVPVLEMGGDMFPESGAIVRWAARKFGLAGKSDAEQLRVEEVLAGADDIRDLFLSWFFKSDPQVKTEVEEQMKQKACGFLGRWEDQARETRSSQRVYTYMVGTSLTAADLTLFDILEQLSSVPSIDLSSYPKLQNIRATVASLTPIKSYLQTRPSYPF
ncbi:hypothetical protein RRG08_065597 [Elysia crispata]|uniref:Glutathione S-transferase n=1 Tax=Elysia crispata TaxID=231223 RepID=A0AAE0YN06_9GAST|nr:hypothetical protein RRG08_065597 [Elysia crispata]